VDITSLSFVKNRIVVTGSFHEGLLEFEFQKHNSQTVGQREKWFKPMLQRKIKSIFFSQYTLSMKLTVFKMHKQTRIPVLFRGISKVTMHIFSSKLT